ncbi:putative reverse transcriptase domain-containing protein [Tanacetum coccineum]
MECQSSRPKTLDLYRLQLANDFMDQKLRTYAERQTDNKRKADDSSRNNHGHQQQPFKRQNVAKVYNEVQEKEAVMGDLCQVTKGSGTQMLLINQKGNGANPKGNGCFECGALGHFKKDGPKLKNKNEGSVNAQGWVYVVGNAEKKGNASRDPDSNVVTENSYDVELADGKIVRVSINYSEDRFESGLSLSLKNRGKDIFKDGIIEPRYSQFRVSEYALRAKQTTTIHYLLTECATLHG